MRIISATDSLHHLQKQAETDDEFWARMEREHPGQQNTSPFLHSPDQTGQRFDEEDHDLDSDEDVPESTSLAEHSHLLRNGFEWDGDQRHPRYTRRTWREIADADGSPAHDEEEHNVDRNSHITRPEFGEDALAYPWTHTYYPAGQSDDDGLTAGYNTAQQATRAVNQLSLWGTRHPESQELLRRYRYLDSDEPYDPSEELPHEAAMGRTGQDFSHEASVKDSLKDLKYRFQDLVDWSADKPWSLGIPKSVRDFPELIKSLRHPDYYCGKRS